MRSGSGTREAEPSRSDRIKLESKTLDGDSFRIREVRHCGACEHRAASRVLPPPPRRRGCHGTLSRQCSSHLGRLDRGALHHRVRRVVGAREPSLGLVARPLGCRRPASTERPRRAQQRLRRTMQRQGQQCTVVVAERGHGPVRCREVRLLPPYLARNIGFNIRNHINAAHLDEALYPGIGGYNCRLIDGSTSWSVHSWGAAVERTGSGTRATRRSGTAEASMA